MSWKSKLLSIIDLYDEKDALKCAKLSDRIYHKTCDTKRTLCVKSNIPAIQIINDNKKKISYVVFRGTKDIYNVKTNMKIFSSNFYNSVVHRGFHTRFLKLRDFMYQNLKHKSVVCTGHSLGGAVATLAAIDLRMNKYHVSLFTFATPPIGNMEFKFLHDKYMEKSWRFIHMNDTITNTLRLLSFVIVGHVFVIHVNINSIQSHRMVRYVESVRSQKYDLARKNYKYFASEKGENL
jgi:predicted lipase